MLKRSSRQFMPILVIALFLMGGAFASAPSIEFEYEPAVWQVGAGGFDTVKEAMDIARDGDIIKLGPGIYDEPIVVNKGVTIVGSPQAIVTTTMIVSTNNWPEIKDTTFIGIWDNATSEGWDAAGIITRQQSGTNSDSYVSNLKVSNCIFRNTRQGIFLFGAKNAIIQDSSFYGNFRGITIRGHFIGNNEVWTSYSNTIRNCNFYNMVGDGNVDGEAIAIFDSDRNTITGCTIDGNSYGVSIEGGTQNTISGNTITNSTYNPLFFENIQSGIVTVTGNTIKDNTENVKFSNATGFTFSNNIMEGNGGPIELYNCNGFTFSNNDINGSTVLLNRSRQGNFAGNSFASGDEQTFAFVGSKINYGHIIGATNTLGGNPIRYYYDLSDVTLANAVAGSVMFMYCPDPTLTNVTVTDGDGIWLFNSGGYNINADVTNSLMGINIENSNGGVMTSATVDPSTRGWQSIRLFSTSGSVSSDCDIRAGSGPAWMLQADSIHNSYNDVFPLNSVDVETAGGGHLKVHNALTVKVWQNGTIGPYEGAEVEVTQDDVPVYQTPHFGGAMSTTDSAGNIHVTVLDREFEYDNDAIEHDHNVTVYASLDAVWTDGMNYIDMSRKRLLEFEMTDIVAPTTPANLAAVVIPVEDAIEVSWDTNLDDTVEYSLYWNEPGDWTLIQNVTGTTFTIDSGLVHGTEYRFIVSAWDEVPLESIWTNMVTVTHVDGLAPAAPTGLAAFSVTGDTIVLEWAANTEVDLEGYNLYINQTGGDWQGPWELVSGGLTALTFTVDGLVSETAYFFVLSAFDEVPNESPFPVALEVSTLDVTPPDPPVLDLLPELTNVASQTITGTAEPGSLVTVFLNGVEVGTTDADPDGTFSYELTLEEEGVNVVTAWSTDASLNTGILSLPASLVYDSIAPDLPEMDGLPEYTNEESITLSGTAEIGSTVTVLVDGQEVGSALVGEGGSWEFTFDLAEGDNVITLRATDPATNVGGTSLGVTVILDTEAPSPDAGENVLHIEEQELTLDGSASTDNEGIATYVWTFKVVNVDETLEGETVTYTFQDPMLVTVTLTVTDLAGNSAEDTVELDIFSKNVAPTLRLGDLGPIKGNTKTTFTFSVTFTDADGDNGEVWVVIDGESILMSPDPDDSDTTNGQEFTYEGKLVKGEHTYYFRGKDSFGNDAGGPSAGEDNAGTSPDVVKYQTESTPGAWATGVLLALAAVALVASIRRRRW
ncbi:MAG: hypothetical protein GQ558_06370 [Thermoplasmata archaeon]|nr:hypothetical protein [Thermoplasmata archaeon]